MASLLDEQTQFLDTGGKPLVGGFLYIGTQNADPKLNPVSIYSDRALTTTIANPQVLDDTGRTTNKIWVNGRYSMKVEDVNNVQQYQELDNGQGTETGITALDNVQGANTITATATVAITAYVDKEQYVFTTAQVNTGNVTLNIDGVGAKSVLKNSDEELFPGDFQQDAIEIVSYNADNDIFEWINRRHTIQPASEVTISTGSITPTRLAHTVDTEADAAADDLDIIATTGLDDGTTLRVSAVSAARVVTIRNEQGGPGQIHLIGDHDISLADTSKTIQFVLRGADWYEVGNDQHGWFPLATKTTTAASTFSMNGDGTDFTMDDTYDNYIVMISGLRPVTDGVDLYLQINVSGSAQTGATDYNFVQNNIESSAGVRNEGATGTTRITLNETTAGFQLGNAVTEGMNGMITLFGPAVVGTHKQIQFDCTYIHDGGTPRPMRVYGSASYTGGTGAIDGITLSMSSGNIAAGGKVTIYGLRLA